MTNVAINKYIPDATSHTTGLNRRYKIMRVTIKYIRKKPNAMSILPQTAHTLKISICAQRAQGILVASRTMDATF